eukprot:scaffold4815_cov363-Prasinococcus_capsulatus_cf.AAC.3
MAWLLLDFVCFMVSCVGSEARLMALAPDPRLERLDPDSAFGVPVGVVGVTNAVGSVLSPPALLTSNTCVRGLRQWSLHVGEAQVFASCFAYVKAAICVGADEVLVPRGWNPSHRQATPSVDAVLVELRGVRLPGPTETRRVCLGSVLRTVSTARRHDGTLTYSWPCVLPAAATTAPPSEFPQRCRPRPCTTTRGHAVSNGRFAALACRRHAPHVLGPAVLTVSQAGRAHAKRNRLESRRPLRVLAAHDNIVAGRIGEETLAFLRLAA